jgi:uncharacterized protein
MITQQFLLALSTRNLDLITSLFAEKVDWYIPGDENIAPWLGKRSSKNEIKEFYELLWASTEPVSATVDNIFTDENKVVISGEFSTKMLQTGKICNSLFFIQFTVENEKIVRYRLLEDSLAVLQALVLKN